MLDAMVCPECGREVRQACRECQAARQRRGILLHQRRFLQTWLVGQMDLRVREQLGVLHIELFDDRWHGYCGEEMFLPTPRRKVRDLPPEICAKCKQVFDDLAVAAGLETNR